jgi:hypothetical protein
MPRLIFISLILLLCNTARGQESIINKSDTLRKNALNVYYPAASNFLKENIPYINYVRDRAVADLIIIATSERNGSGGTKYSLFLEGQKRFSGMLDTLDYSCSSDETTDQQRDKEVHELKLGLTRYILKTPLSKYLSINFSEHISSEVSTDKWNNWVFSANLSGFGFGESTQSSIDLDGGFSANKVTEDWKLNFITDYSYGQQKFILTDTNNIETTYLSDRRSKSAHALVVKSLSDHWSIGGSARISSSTYSNYDLRLSIMPGIEYDIFPYSESTRRQLRILYSIGYLYNNYTEMTEFDKMEEGLLVNSLAASYEVIQKWGSISFSTSWSNYLRNFSENSLRMNGNLSWRVAKGLSINMGGNYSFIRDQISIPKGGATAEEIFLRRKELRTSYNFFVHFGLSYTFGSIYNNVVNPRFGSRSGSRTIIIN